MTNVSNRNIKLRNFDIDFIDGSIAFDNDRTRSHIFNINELFKVYTKLELSVGIGNK